MHFEEVLVGPQGLLYKGFIPERFLALLQSDIQLSCIKEERRPK